MLLLRRMRRRLIFWRRVRREWVLAESGDLPLAAAVGMMSQFDSAAFGPQIEAMAAQIVESVLLPDAGVSYVADYAYEASMLEPYVACPHSVDNVVPVSDLVGTRVQQAFVGTCTNGRLVDVAAAAVAGRHVAAATRLLIIPASKQVLTEAMRLGYIDTLLEAGAILGVPGCDMFGLQWGWCCGGGEFWPHFLSQCAQQWSAGCCLPRGCACGCCWRRDRD